MGLVTSEHAPTAKMSAILKREYPTAGGHLRNHGGGGGALGRHPLEGRRSAISVEIQPSWRRNGPYACQWSCDECLSSRERHGILLVSPKVPPAFLTEGTSDSPSLWTGSGTGVDGKRPNGVVQRSRIGSLRPSLDAIAACVYGRRAVTLVSTPTCCLLPKEPALPVQFRRCRPRPAL